MITEIFLLMYNRMRLSVGSNRVINKKIKNENEIQCTLGHANFEEINVIESIIPSSTFW